jgi:membrane protease YdiL (CAAX protease family)
MVVPFAASLFYFVFFSEHYFARVVYGAAKAFTVVWPAIAVWFVCRATLPRIDLRARKHRKAIPLGILSGTAFLIVILGVMQTSLGQVVADSSEVIRHKAQELGISQYFWPLAVFLSLVNSLIEEYYWRWFVFGHLREVVYPYLAHALAGISFAAHHVVVTTQFFPVSWGLVLGGCVGAAGVLWSVMYHRQQTLVGVWISHLIADVGIMWIGYNILFVKGPG